MRFNSSLVLSWSILSRNEVVLNFVPSLSLSLSRESVGINIWELHAFCKTLPCASDIVRTNSDLSTLDLLLAHLSPMIPLCQQSCLLFWFRSFHTLFQLAFFACTELKTDGFVPSRTPSPMIAALPAIQDVVTIWSFGVVLFDETNLFGIPFGLQRL